MLREIPCAAGRPAAAQTCSHPLTLLLSHSSQACPLKPGGLLGPLQAPGCSRAGKSSLAAAMLGEIPCISGRIAVGGRVAYVPQQAWIMNATLKVRCAHN